MPFELTCNHYGLAFIFLSGTLFVYQACNFLNFICITIFALFFNLVKRIYVFFENFMGLAINLYFQDLLSEILSLLQLPSGYADAVEN